MKAQKILNLTTLPILLASVISVPANAIPVNFTYEADASQLLAQQNPDQPTFPRFARVTAVSGNTVSVVYRDEVTQDLDISPNLDTAEMELIEPGAIVVAHKGELINTVTIGQISEMTDSVATVDFPGSSASDKTTKEYEVSSGDLAALKLSEGLYVGILDDQIIGVASVGHVVGMAGNVANVRMLLDGKLLQIGVGAEQIGAMGVKEGMLVYVVDDKIVEVANNLAETRLGIPAESPME